VTLRIGFTGTGYISKIRAQAAQAQPETELCRLI
jgi:hypothetical protein